MRFTLVALCFAAWGVALAQGVPPGARGRGAEAQQITDDEARFERIAAMWRLDPSNGTALAKQEIAKARAANDSVSIAFGFYALGVNQWALGQNLDAARSYMESIDIAEKWGDSKILAKNYNNMGLLYYALGTFSEAKNWFLRAYELRVGMGDSAGLGRVVMNLGMLARQSSTIDTARALFNRGLLLLFDAGDSVNLARGRHYLGETYAAEGKYREALRWYEKAKDVFLRVPDRMGHALLLVEIAKAYDRLGNTKRARDIAVDALHRGEALQAPFVIRESADLLHRVLARSGNFTAAYRMLEMAGRFADSLRNESTLHAIASLELRYMLEQQRVNSIKETRLREKEIEGTLRRAALVRNMTIAGLLVLMLLAIGLWMGIRHVRKVNQEITNKNREIETINDRLQRIDESREKLFSIIGHDLRGPMASIIGMAELLNDRYEDLTDIEKGQLLDALGISAKATYETLENLLNWSRTQYGDLSFTPEFYEIDPLLEEQKAMLLPMAQKKRIDLRFSGERGNSAYLDRSMLTTVLRNLISNAIKFTGEGGVVTVEVLRTERWLRFSVTDTGIGIEPSRLEELLQRRVSPQHHGTMGEQGTGLGLEICHSFLERHGGYLEIQSTPGLGSEFRVFLPLIDKKPGLDKDSAQV